MRGEIGRVLDDEGPLCKRQPKSAKGTVTGRNGVTEARQHQESDPVEEERHQKTKIYKL